MSDLQVPKSDDIDALLAWAVEVATEKQLRLFACACCRRIWQLVTDERSRKAVEIAESYANGGSDIDTLRQANKAARDAWVENSVQVDDHVAAAAFYCSILKPAMLPAAANRVQAVVLDKESEKKQQAAILRSIINDS
jgi:hypothetical protein